MIQSCDCASSMLSMGRREGGEERRGVRTFCFWGQERDPGRRGGVGGGERDYLLREDYQWSTPLWPGTLAIQTTGQLVSQPAVSRSESICTAVVHQQQPPALFINYFLPPFPSSLPPSPPYSFQKLQSPIDGTKNYVGTLSSCRFVG